jgi:hypothetical protein
MFNCYLSLFVTVEVSYAYVNVLCVAVFFGISFSFSDMFLFLVNKWNTKTIRTLTNWRKVAFTNRRVRIATKKAAQHKQSVDIYIDGLNNRFSGLSSKCTYCVVSTCYWSGHVTGGVGAAVEKNIEWGKVDTWNRIVNWYEWMNGKAAFLIYRAFHNVLRDYKHLLYEI